MGQKSSSRQPVLPSSLFTNSVMAPLLENWRAIELPQCWLVAGCLAQTVWNEHFGFSPSYGISDIDLVYFDRSNLGVEEERRHALRIQKAFPELDIRLDVKNEARVHLWYEDKFGYSMPPYQSTKAAIATFPTTATAVGIRPKGEVLNVYAPFGVKDLLSGTVRANKVQINQHIYMSKVTKWVRQWPDLRVVEWEDA